ncbi:MAG TPA: NAD(P)-binding domain-containing protein, partial [Burkholderiaceae bacterium]|nr:NAD(P)-binding domain-containing protein [Burkholderiaceae bacterium]
MSKVGFVGLGIMGAPMAGHLLRAGYELYVYNIRKYPQQLLDAGAKRCASAREVAQNAEIIITMVPDTPQVASVLFDADGIAAGLTSGKIVVDMSSISP